MLKSNQVRLEQGGPYKTKSEITDVSPSDKYSDKGYNPNKGKAIKNKGTNL